MGPGRSFSLRIGDDSSVIVGTERAGGAYGRSAIFEPRNAAEAPPLPLDEGKEKINLITYPGGSDYLKYVVQHAVIVGPSKVDPSYGSTFAERYRPPPGVRIWVPDVLTFYAASVPGMVCFFEVAFDNGLRFPLHPFMKRVLQHFNICPSQLAPNGWEFWQGYWLLLGIEGSASLTWPCSFIFFAQRRPSRAFFIFPDVPELPR